MHAKTRHKKREPPGSLDVKKYYLMMFCPDGQFQCSLYIKEHSKTKAVFKALQQRIVDLFSVQPWLAVVHYSGKVYAFQGFL